jgi:hypothetical protein
VFVAMTVGAAACSESAPPVAGVPGHLESGAVMDVGLESPAAVVHDAVADRYLVSSAGFISRLHPDGAVEDLRWVDGREDHVVLEAPTGMAIAGDTLYVADGPCLRRFHRRTGASVGSSCPQGIDRLVDVAVDERGRVHVIGRSPVGGRAGSAVYIVDEGGDLEPVQAGGEDSPLEAIVSGPRGLFVATSGVGRVFQIGRDGPVDVITGRGDDLAGIVFTRDGSFAFSNRTDSTVLLVEARHGGARGYLWTLGRSLGRPGDLGYDAIRGRVLIPDAAGHRLIWVRLGRGAR